LASILATALRICCLDGSTRTVPSASFRLASPRISLTVAAARSATFCSSSPSADMSNGGGVSSTAGAGAAAGGTDLGGGGGGLLLLVTADADNASMDDADGALAKLGACCCCDGCCSSFTDCPSWKNVMEGLRCSIGELCGEGRGLLLLFQVLRPANEASPSEMERFMGPTGLLPPLRPPPPPPPNDGLLKSGGAGISSSNRGS